MDEYIKEWNRLAAEFKEEVLNSTAVKMLEEKKEEFEKFVKEIKIKEDKLPFEIEKIEREFGDAIKIWILEACQISDRCRNDIAGGNEKTDSTPISVSALLTIVGNIDMRFTVAIEILKGAAKLMESKKPNNLASFNHQWIESLKAQKIDFLPFKFYLYNKYNFYGSDSELNNMTEAEVLKVMDLYILDRVIEPKKVGRLYTDAWLASTKDKDTGYWAAKDEDAGYICIRMIYVCPVVTYFNLEDIATNGTWKLSKAYIDDVEKPAGTKQRLINEFDAETKLIDLPYKVVVNIQVQQNSPGRKFLPDNNKFYKTPGGDWKKISGNPTLINTFFKKMKNKYTLNDLTAE